MPAASPWMDYAAPAQWATFSQPHPDHDPVTGGQDSGALARFTGWLSSAGHALTARGAAVSANNQQVDTTLHWKLSGTIILGLLIVFGLSAMGFRFVSSANVSFGR